MPHVCKHTGQQAMQAQMLAIFTCPSHLNPSLGRLWEAKGQAIRHLSTLQTLMWTQSGRDTGTGVLSHAVARHP